MHLNDSNRKDNKFLKAAGFFTGHQIQEYCKTLKIGGNIGRKWLHRIVD